MTLNLDPNPQELNEAFWEACAQGVLLVQECEGCGQVQYPPLYRCSRCGGKVAYRQSDGRGVITTYSVVHRAQDHRFHAPYVVVIAHMDEGWDLLTHLKGEAPEAELIGRRINIVCEMGQGEQWLPLAVLED